MKVSVLLPVFNAEAYLKTAIESILSQTFTDFELRILDDGSTDGSLAIICSYVKHPRVSYFGISHSGVANALNALAYGAYGTYLARMDADDISWPERFAKQVAFLDANPDCSVLGTRVRLINADGGVLSDPYPKLCRGEHTSLDADHLECRKGLFHPSVMLRAEQFRLAGGYRREYEGYEDFDLFLRMAEVGRVECLPEVLLDYRQHASMVSVREASRRKHTRHDLIYEARMRRWERSGSFSSYATQYVVA